MVLRCAAHARSFMFIVAVCGCLTGAAQISLVIRAGHDEGQDTQDISEGKEQAHHAAPDLLWRVTDRLLPPPPLLLCVLMFFLIAPSPPPHRHRRQFSSKSEFAGAFNHFHAVALVMCGC